MELFCCLLGVMLVSSCGAQLSPRWTICLSSTAVFWGVFKLFFMNSECLRAALAGWVAQLEIFGCKMLFRDVFLQDTHLALIRHTNSPSVGFGLQISSGRTTRREWQQWKHYQRCQLRGDERTQNGSELNSYEERGVQGEVG